MLIQLVVACRQLDCSAPSSRVSASSPVTKSPVSASTAQPAPTLSGSPPTITLIASLPRYIITLPFPQRTVAFPLHRTAHPLWDAPPSRTIEGRFEAKPAFHARPLVEGSLSRTSWVR